MPKNENWFLMYWDMAAALGGFACAAHSVLNSCANCIASQSTPLTLERESIEEEAGVSRSLSPVKHCPELEASSAVSEASTLCCTAAAFLLLPANLHRLVFGIPSLAEIEKHEKRLDRGCFWWALFRVNAHAQCKSHGIRITIRGLL